MTPTKQGHLRGAVFSDQGHRNAPALKCPLPMSPFVRPSPAKSPTSWPTVRACTSRSCPTAPSTGG
ncbi:hypothetical protein BVI1335_450021 [Burkholderia vietnamiensis]|nr:hypothetical protein BVI1335_450021 [Burkholderia vietnamiensis]